MKLQLEGLEIGITITALSNYIHMVEEAIAIGAPDNGIVTHAFALQTAKDAHKKLTEGEF